MAADTTILSTDVGVWWFNNNRSKMLTWEGTTGTYTMNELYSAMQTLQDESDTIDDGTCFNADTPTEYTIGKIDQGDNDPWYITFELMEHITGGSLKTSGWAHVQGSNTGIVIVPGTNVDIVPGDCGLDIAGGEDGNGTLLELISGFRGDFLVIRPDSSASGDEFTGGGDGQTITCNGHTFTQSSEEQNSGNMIWANLYSIGTIDDYVHQYIYQGSWDADTATTPATDNSQRIYSVNSSAIDYWGEGHIDICIPTKRWWRAESDGAWDACDGGYARVFARKGGDLFAYFEVATSTTSGGRNPIPLQTSVDLNQGTGTKTISFTGTVSGGPFIDGEVIEDQNNNARGILDLSNSDVGSGGYLSYFPIAKDGSGGLLTAMQSGQTIQGATSSASVTSDGTPQDAGPAVTSFFTNSAFPDIKFGFTAVTAVTNKDIDNNGTDEHWGIVVDCNSNTLAETYEWLKYICSYTQGETDSVEQALEDDLSQSNVFGEEFRGAMGYIGYSAISGTLAEGEAVTQATSGATGIILMHDTTNDVVLFRDVRGSFNGTNQVDADYDSDYFTPDEGSSFAPSATSPFGTFAGGTFFGARGVIIENWLSNDENSFILTDIEGTTRERPTSVPITVTNLHGNAITETDADLVAIYTLSGSGGDIDKDLLTCDGGEVEGGTSIATDTISTWTPSSGRLLLTDVSEGDEYIIGYSSWDSGTDTFTLDSYTIANATTGTNANTIVSTTDELDTLDRGDFIWNEDQNAGAYITDVQAATNTVNLDRDITGQTSVDTIKVNVVPLTLTSSDTVLPLIMHGYPTASTKQSSIIYPGSTLYIRVKVRNSRETDLVNGPIKPYSADDSITGTDTSKSYQVTRTIDTIIT